MVITRKNRGGYITAYIEYRLKDKYKTGDFCYINDLWVHEHYRNMGNVMYFIKRVARLNPEVEFIYFIRDKHDGRMAVYEVLRTKTGDIKFKRRKVTNE